MEYVTNEIALGTKQQIIKKIIENDFEYEADYSYMYVDIDNKKYKLSNNDVFNFTKSTIEMRVKIMNGMSATEFAQDNGTHIGYRIYDKLFRTEFFQGNYVEDKSKHGLYFTIRKEELFRFVMVSHMENFGDAIAKISLQKPDGTYIENAAIQKGPDTPNTYRSHGFYVLETYSLDDYDLMINLYSIADDQYKLLAYDESLCEQSIEYFCNKKCLKTVKALNDIHKMEIRRLCNGNYHSC